MKGIRRWVSAAVFGAGMLAVAGHQESARADSCWWEKDDFGNWRYVCVA